ncbi:MAG: MATE family efflux transporter, partial [Paracoccaceae bacterium]
MQNDNLTSGPMATHFKTLAVPAAFGMLFTTLYNVVDVYFAGLISTDAQAGMAIGFQAFFILMAFGFGLGSGLSALVSNAKGAEDTGSTKSFAAQGLSYGAIATLVLMAVGVLSGPWLIQLISEPGSYRIAATGYFHWLIFALPGFLLAYASNGILQAHGDSKSMQRAMMAAFFANIGLNPLLMFGIPGLWGGMGFNGIAVATILSQTGVMAFLIWRVFQLDMFDRITKVDFVPKWDAIKSITVQMLPTGTAMLVMFTSGFVVQYFLKAFGPEAIAAYGVALRIEQILLLPILGMTGALLPIAGQNFGAKDYDRVRAAVRFCWQLGFLMCLIACPILLFGGHIAM